MDLILGTKVIGHDTSVALLNEKGDVLYALAGERFSNIKHDTAFPIACYLELKKKIAEEKLGRLKYIAFAFDPARFINPRLFSYTDKILSNEQNHIFKTTILDALPNIQTPEQGLAFTKQLHANPLLRSLPEKVWGWFDVALHFYQENKAAAERLKGLFPESEFIFVNHHEAHAASAFYASGFEKAAVLCADGFGEDETSTLYKAEVTGLSLLSASKMPHSLGLFYEIITEYLGFDGFSDPYKVMGMAAYGRPLYESLFEQMGQVHEDGTFTLNFGDLLEEENPPVLLGTRPFSLSTKLQDLLGGKRSADAPIEQAHYDVACSFQTYIEKIGVSYALYLRKTLPSYNAICLSGGVALNGLMNQRIFKEAGFDKIFIQPASADDGTSLGAAWVVIADKYGPPAIRRIKDVFLGLKRTASEAKAEVEKLGLAYSCPQDPAQKVAELLAQDYVVARYTGRSEFGPRALGNRSILASPLKAEMKDIINSRIKHREPFRPFAPVCLAEDVSTFFDADEDAEYMLLICPVKEDKKKLIPAVVHQDGTARVQSVKKDSNPGLYEIISAFKKITGVPIIINTSFNVNGEAIVETPLDALECFLYTNIDYLLIEDMLIAKSENEDKRIYDKPEDFLNRRRNRFGSRIIELQESLAKEA